MPNEAADKLAEALAPFALAADKADERMAEHISSGMGRLTDNASPGLGIKFGHLFRARTALAEYRRTDQ